MAYTKVQIANMALAKVGDEGGQISSFTDDSKEANLISKFYEPARREVLRMHPWKCARARARLAQDLSDPTFGWDNQYSLPADCVRPLVIANSSTSDRSIMDESEWVVEGRKVLTNMDECYLLYIKNLTDPNDMDELFIRCLYTHLAMMLAYPLTQSKSLVSMIEREMRLTIMPDAKRVNAYEGLEFPVLESDWLQASLTTGYFTNTRLTFDDTDYGTITS